MIKKLRDRIIWRRMRRFPTNPLEWNNKQWDIAMKAFGLKPLEQWQRYYLNRRRVSK